MAKRTATRSRGGLSSGANARVEVGKAGILAAQDKFASLAEDTAVCSRADARHVAADDVGRPSSRSLLTSNTRDRRGY